MRVYDHYPSSSSTLLRSECTGTVVIGMTSPVFCFSDLAPRFELSANRPRGWAGGQEVTRKREGIFVVRAKSQHVPRQLHRRMNVISDLPVQRRFNRVPSARRADDGGACVSVVVWPSVDSKSVQPVGEDDLGVEMVLCVQGALGPKLGTLEDVAFVGDHGKVHESEDGFASANVSSGSQDPDTQAVDIVLIRMTKETKKVCNSTCIMRSPSLIAAYKKMQPTTR
ncbi:hypothetical protein MKZ38_002086 [Zalerion maritima]|uniref:Uncharacterized protein n=1 Tax=Zalerion maritima TaxID=339359 RepID=A0AAD5RXB3_9PEZI|nr:hypothetical protein MKZ38_002086 [Zalerion maritima]